MVKIIFFAVLTFMTIAGCSNSDMIISKKKVNIQIDGKLDEWNTNTFQSCENGNLLINATYDDRNIYVACKCLDRNIGRLFALNGVKVWIDPEGQKEQSLELDIKYEGQRKFDFQKGYFFALLDSSQKSKVYPKLEKINNGVLVLDKKSVESKVFYKNYDTAFDGKMLISGNDLNFEFKIPRNLNQYFRDFSDLKLNTSFICIAIGRSSFSNFRGIRPGMMEGSRNGAIIPGISGSNRRTEIPEEPNPEIWIKLNVK